MITKKIKVLIVDDSLALCKILERIFSQDPDFDVVGYALEPFEARDMIKIHKPDVITLDVEMPRMDGLTFLKNLMRLNPMPVVMFSSLTAAGATVTMDALQAGAVDFMVKRQAETDQHFDQYVDEIREKVKNAALVNVGAKQSGAISTTLPDLSDLKSKLRAGRKINGELNRVVAVGSSTGGPDALNKFLTGLDMSKCAMMFAQHMPGRFMDSFAERLNSWSSFTIKVAENGEQIKPGRGYVAPGDTHLELVSQGGKLVCLTRKTDPVCGHRPSVDVLFKSVASSAGNASIGVLLTGMGEDGALGLKAMRDAGAMTLIQDKKSSAVWGMPGRAFELGGADGVLPLQKMSPALTSLLKNAA